GTEIDRVLAAIESLEVDGHLDGLIGRLVRKGERLPWLQTEHMNEMNPTSAGKPQFAEISRQGSLQLAGIDPGIARYLGYAGQTPWLPQGGGDAISIFGLFAVDIKGFQRVGLNLDHLAQYTPQSFEVKAYAETLRVLGFDRAQEIEALALSVLERGCAIAP